MITINIPSKEARQIVQGDHEDWTSVHEEMSGHRRWNVDYYGVFKRLSDNTLWSVNWSVGATESQYERPFEWESEATFTRMIEKQVVTTEYVAVE